MILSSYLFKVFTNKCRPHIRSHYYNRIFEINHPTLIISQAAIIKHLQQYVENIGMSFLHLIKQNHRIWFATNSLCQLSTLIISYISRRCSNQSGSTKLLLIFTHINTSHHIFIIKQIISQSLCQLCLTHTCGSKKNKRANWSSWIAKPCPITPYSIRNSSNSLFLSHHTLVKFIFQIKQLLTFALHHFAHRYAGPSSHHIGNIFRVNLFLYHCLACLLLMKLRFQLIYLGFHFFYFAVSQFSYFAIISFTLSFISFKLSIFNIYLVLLNLIDNILFRLPASLHHALFFAQVFNLLAQHCFFINIIFTTNCFALYLKLFYSAHNFIKLFRNRVNLHSQLSCSLIHQVDSFVRQKPISNISVRKLNSCNDSLIFDSHFVVIFVSLFQSPQN